MGIRKKMVVALVQARIGSTRLPGKILKNLEGKPVIWHIWNRLMSVNQIDDVVIATSIESANNTLIECLEKYGIKYFRGSENNVLDRFYKAAKFFKADVVIRITADCPLVDPHWVGEAVQKIIDNSSIDYVGLAAGAGVLNDNINKFPDGLDTEVFKYEALNKAWKEAENKLDRGEAVTSYIWRNKDKFNTVTLYPDSDYGNFRWTLDTHEDYKFIKNVYKKLYSKKNDFNMNDILELLKRMPELTEINNTSKNQVKYCEYYSRDSKR